MSNPFGLTDWILILRLSIYMAEKRTDMNSIYWVINIFRVSIYFTFLVCLHVGMFLKCPLCYLLYIQFVKSGPEITQVNLNFDTCQYEHLYYYPKSMV